MLAIRLIVKWPLSAVVLMVVLGWCGNNPLVQLGLIAPTATPDRFEHHRAVLQPAFRDDLEAAGPLPHYHITAQLAADQTLQGVMRVIIPQPGQELIFRLYPNLPHYNGRLTVTLAKINNQPVATTLLAEETALRLAVPLTEGNRPASAIVEMAFTVQLGRQPTIEETYTLFGWAGSILSLPGFYPMLAGQQAGNWVVDIPPLHGDVLFSEMAVYQLDIQVPAELVVVSSGLTLNVIDNPNGSRTWQLVGGPLRDMTVIAGPFQAVNETTAGTTVVSYYLAGDEVAGQRAVTHAAAAVRFYNELYGPYPYTELDIVAAPLNKRGMEYSGLVLIGQGLYDPDNDYLPFLVAHEVAHQWWYHVVGNNPYQYPWLDEGLTEYSAFEYYRQVFGQPAAERMMTGQWFIPFTYAANGRIEGVVDRPAAAFNPTNYHLLAYLKAAMFFNALRNQLGEATYHQVLQQYYAENKYRIVTPQTLLATAERVSGQNLNHLAEMWLR